jgi:hypothetical protein
MNLSRIANEKLASHSIRSEGSFPRTKFIAQFVYESGLVVEMDGDNWTVILDPKEQAATA